MNQTEIVNFHADQCNRQPVTAEWLYQHPDETGYLFNHTSNEMGLDPWRVISGVDKIVKGRDTGDIVLWIGSTGEKQVSQDYIVFISKKVKL
jgi:hypothetical protein